MLQKAKVAYNFYRFWVINGKPKEGGGGKINPPSPPIQIRLK